MLQLEVHVLWLRCVFVGFRSFLAQKRKNCDWRWRHLPKLSEFDKTQQLTEAANSDKEVQRLQTKCRTLEVEKVELEASFARCKDALSQEELKSSEALANLTGTKKKEAELQLNLDLLQRSLKDQEAAVAAGRDQQTQELQGTLTELQLSFQEVDVKKNALEEEVQRLQTKCRTLEVEKVELEASFARCKDALSQEELKSSEALANLTGTKKKEAELQLNLDLLQRSLKDQEAAVAAGRDQQTQELQGTLTELQLSFQEVDVKKNALEEEVQRLQTKCRTLEVEKVELEASFARCKDALSQEELKSSEALANLTGTKKKEAELQLNLDLLQRSLKDQEAAVAAGRDQQTQELQGALTELQLSFQEVDVKKNALEEEVQRLQTKCRTLEVEKVELEARSAQSPIATSMVSELCLGVTGV